MIRVAFVLEDYTWLGGVNYYRNLFSALSLLPKQRIAPILFLSNKTPSSVTERLQFCELVLNSAFDRRSPAALFRKAIKGIPGQRDIFLGALLAHHKIDVLSHAADLYWPRNIRTIGWIPDFQHLHIPSFFSGTEMKQRDREYARIALRCDRIMLSSFTAQLDFARIAPQAANRSRILRFVPDVDLAAIAHAFEPLQNKYQIEKEYFFLPNQFWIHKNHIAVITALNILKARGVNPIVVATGHTADPRSGRHFSSLMQKARALGVENSFRVLGVVPYRDMISLMSHSRAVINPSLFEGWSSTVEEAKILGKTILLSDLPVHREQNPERAFYFDPHDPHSLANSLLTVLQSVNDDDHVGEKHASAYMLARKAFAVQYESLVMEVMDLGARH